MIDEIVGPGIDNARSRLLRVPEIFNGTFQKRCSLEYHLLNIKLKIAGNKKLPKM